MATGTVKEKIEAEIQKLQLQRAQVIEQLEGLSEEVRVMNAQVQAKQAEINRLNEKSHGFRVAITALRGSLEG